MQVQDAKIKFIGVQPDEILYFRAMQGIVFIILTDNTQISCNKSLSELEQHPALTDFYRVNRSLLVNVKKIKTLFSDNDQTSLKMMNGYTAVFSKSRINQFIYQYAKEYFFL